MQALSGNHSNMAEYGYALSSEEHMPNDLVRYARRAEELGFSFAMISDHFHPWIDKQGQSPFVWSVIGAIAHQTERIRLGTGVTCPTIRTHPAVIAQAAATSGAMMPGRFFLGVGSGENLNEHITGEYWPPADVRLEMLAEAVKVIRLLWEGGVKSHRGKHYTVDNARIYTLPDEPPEIYVAAGGPKAATLAGELGDGFIGVGPNAEIREKFLSSGGEGKPTLGQVAVCWAETEEAAKKTAHEWWPNVAFGGQMNQELKMPALFEAAAENVGPDEVAKKIACGPDPERHLESIRKYTDAGFDHVYIHQIGPDQEGFFDFYEREVLPKLG
jgi:coenzyme F420-dependent glucose-6-phosphate dehydrogenase